MGTTTVDFEEVAKACEADGDRFGARVYRMSHRQALHALMFLHGADPETADRAVEYVEKMVTP